MDPITVITVVGLVAAATRLIKLYGSAAAGLGQLHSRQSRATSSLLSIRSEYTTIRAAIESIKVWAETDESKLPSRKAQRDALEEALKALAPSVQIVADDVEKFLMKSDEVHGSFTTKKKIQYLWNGHEIKSHLDEARWQSSHVHFLVSTLSL
jgi:hypothetical protein